MAATSNEQQLMSHTSTILTYLKFYFIFQKDNVIAQLPVVNLFYTCMADILFTVNKYNYAQF